MKRIAIIGSGISGLGAAFALKDTADITVFEANDRAGGHAHTMDVDYDGDADQRRCRLYCLQCPQLSEFDRLF